MGVTHVTGSPYHPESQAVVERCIFTLKNLMRVALVDSDTTQWDTILPMIAFAMRSAKCESTGFSPFELIFGFNCRNILDLFREGLLAKPPEERPVDSSEYIHKLRKLMYVLSKWAVAHEQASKEARK